MDWLDRESMLIGPEAVRVLRSSSVVVVGLGGVGAAAAEALVRLGVGTLTAVDFDNVSETNLNRQLFADRTTLGLKKTEAAARRLLAINPGLELELREMRVDADNAVELMREPPNCLIDACDNVTAKIALAAACKASGVPEICCLGTGNRTDPTGFRIGPIEQTAGCGCALARVMRREFRKHGLQDQTVLFSNSPVKETGSRIPGSVSFVPPVAGYLLAWWAAGQLLGRAGLSL